MKSARTTLMQRSTLSLLIGAIATQPMAWAAVPIAQFPAGTSAKLPAPNVIVSIDDSPSMSAADMTTLRNSLINTFTEANVPDGAIRLGWQSMTNCFEIPQAGCSNEVRVLDNAQRTRFLSWVNTLTQTYSGTPTHRMLLRAGEYYRHASDINGPWASVPGSALEPVLSCRRSYNVLMTDGGWNVPFGQGASSGSSWPNAHLAWNAAPHEAAAAAIGNADGTSRSLGDGTLYDVTSNQTRIYRDSFGGTSVTDPYGSGTLPTLSDIAFHYWATDLQPTIPNSVKPIVNEAGPRTVTSGSQTMTLEEKWNPRNNPATWQHMTTYTVGFNTAANWNSVATPLFGTDTWTDGDYASLLLGLTSWVSPMVPMTPNTTAHRMPELWHMALNSRGRFIPAPDANSLAPAFANILNEIITDSSTPITSAVSSSTSLARTGSSAFTAGYKAEKWSGAVNSTSIAQGSGEATTNSSWGGQSTANKLDAITNLNNRLILSWREGSTSPAVDGATVFKWAASESRLSTLQKSTLFTAAEADTEGQARLDYLRGDRSRETAATGTPRFRERESRQGDIVNSQVWYVAQPTSNHSFEGYASFANTHKARRPMLYVGGNDGMLHGFSAEDGSEKIAYVPKGVIPSLHLLTQTGYNSHHRYFVDGSPFTGDVNWGSSTTPNWRTLLVSTLGAGGKGYFVLDVTTPGNKTGGAATPASNFSEGNAAALVVMDRTTPTGTDIMTVGADGSPVIDTTSAAAHIGQITVAPVKDDTNPFVATQITRLNNGKWAVVMGNGYNSSADRPALLIQYLDGDDKTLMHIPVTAATAAGDGNGLSAPRLVDLDGDGKTDVVYAGDMKGNLWKFDLLDSSPSSWNVSFSGAPLYTATHSASSGATANAQPITAAPVVRANSRGTKGLMVAFGTGRNLTVADRDSTAAQTLYSVLDNTTYKREEGDLVIDSLGTAIGSGTSKLVAQTVSSTSTVAGRDLDRLSTNDVPYEGDNAKRGWYFNLPDSGERLLETMSFYDGSNILEVLTEIPASGSEAAGESCDPQSRGARYVRTFINIMDGKAPSFQVIDLNGDGWFNADDGGVSRLQLKGAPGLKMDNACAKNGCKFQVNKRGEDDFSQAPIRPLRPSWRHLQ